MEFEDFEIRENVQNYLHFFTSHYYSFAVSSQRIWGDNKKKRVDDEDLTEYETEEVYVNKLRDYKNGTNSVSASEVYEVEDGTFWQIMPDSDDDGFFDWYCYVREDYQFFRTKEICILYFIKYWTEWNRTGKPNWQESQRYLVI